MFKNSWLYWIAMKTMRNSWACSENSVACGRDIYQTSCQVLTNENQITLQNRSQYDININATYEFRIIANAD